MLVGLIEFVSQQDSKEFQMVNEVYFGIYLCPRKKVRKETYFRTAKKSNFCK